MSLISSSALYTVPVISAGRHSELFRAAVSWMSLTLNYTPELKETLYPFFVNMIWNRAAEGSISSSGPYSTRLISAYDMHGVLQGAVLYGWKENHTVLKVHSLATAVWNIPESVGKVPRDLLPQTFEGPTRGVGSVLMHALANIGIRNGKANSVKIVCQSPFTPSLSTFCTKLGFQTVAPNHYELLLTKEIALYEKAISMLVAKQEE